MRNRTLIIAIALCMLLVGGMSASAEIRLDAAANVPVYYGMIYNGGSGGVWNSYFVPFPEVDLYYQFGDGGIRGGVGARVFSFIIENVLYPNAYLEVNLDKFVLTANVGGFVFLEFGLLSSVLSENGYGNLSGFHSLIVPDVNFSYKVSDIFRIGVGCVALIPFDSYLQGAVFVPYINARFVILFEGT